MELVNISGLLSQISLQQIFNEYTTAVFGKNPEVIQNLKLQMISSSIQT